MNTTSLQISTVLLLLSSACVTQGTYDKLKQDSDNAYASLQKKASDDAAATNAANAAAFAAASADLTARDQTITQQKAQLAQEQETVATLQKQADDLAAQKKQLESDVSKMLKDKTAMAASVTDMKNALADLSKRKAEADARLGEFRSLIGRFRSLIDSGKLRIKMAEGKMVVEMATDVLFASGSASLSKEGKAAIGEVSALLNSIPNRSFQIEGHTDNAPIATAQYPSNWELGAGRAITVLKTMIEAGLPASRISAATYGDSKPARANDSAEAKSANRRIQIVVQPDLSSLPGFDELNKAAAQ